MGYAEKDSYSLVKRLKHRLKELANTPVDMNPIRIDDILLEFVAIYCDTDKFIAKLKAIKEPQHGPKQDS